MWQALMTDDDDLLTDLQVRRSKGSEVKEGHRGQVGQQGQRGQGGQRSLAICYMLYIYEPNFMKVTVPVGISLALNVIAQVVSIP